LKAQPRSADATHNATAATRRPRSQIAHALAPTHAAMIAEVP
jgi:hypothetical protein